MELLIKLTLMGIAFSVLINFVGVAFRIARFFADWRIFSKAGVAGWKSLIPFYSTIVQFDLTWDRKWAYVFLGSGVANNVIRSMIEEGNTSATLGMISNILTIVYIALNILSMYYLARSFGKGKKFTLGLYFLEPLFIIILAYGKSRYLGNRSQDYMKKDTE